MVSKSRFSRRDFNKENYISSKKNTKKKTRSTRSSMTGPLQPKKINRLSIGIENNHKGKLSKRATKKSSSNTSKRLKVESNIQKLSPALEKINPNEMLNGEKSTKPAKFDPSLYPCQSIQENASAVFDDKILEDIKNALNYKMRSSKFKYSQRTKEQADLIKILKRLLKDYQNRNNHYMEAGFHIEERFNFEKEQCNNNMALAK